jgi:hypothetical protein
MTLQDVKRRLKVMKVRGYNANTVRDMEWLVAEVRALELQIEGARRERDIAVRAIERIRGHLNEYLSTEWVQP